MKIISAVILLSLTLVLLSTSSCKKKKGCTALHAHNYDSEAKKDDGSCETCADGVQNGDETGVDCGGKCINSCGNTFQGWKTFQGPTTKDLYSAHFLDKNTGWISGDNGALYKTTSGGASWTDLSLATDRRIAHIDFVDISNGWAIASDWDSTSLMNTTDGGISWNTILTGDYYFFSDVEFLSTSTGYAVASFGLLSSFQGTVVYKTTDGGASWESDTLNGVTMVTLFAVSANEVWMSGDNGSIWYTLDGALTWEPESGGTSMVLNDIFIYGNTGVAVANQGNVISYSSDGGGNWDTYFVWDVQDYRSVYVINADECYAVGVYPYNFEQGVIMYSNDGGATWEHQFPETNTVSEELHDIYFADATHGWIVGFNGTIFRVGY